MQELLLVNPAKRPAKRRKTRKAASPAQKRARAAFAAAARARSKGVSVMANPRKRRRTKRTARRTVARARNPAPRAYARKRRTVSRRRRNPIGTEKPMQLITPAIIGAVGATVVNTLMAQIAPMLPASLTGSQNAQYLVNAAAALGLAMLAPHAGSKKQMVLQMAEGSLTVTLHSAIVSNTGGLGMTLSGYRKGGRMGMYMPGMGAQAVPNAGGNPAQLAGMNAYLTGQGSPQARVQAARQVAMANKGSMKGFGF